VASLRPTRRPNQRQAALDGALARRSVPYSSEVQQPMHATAVLGSRPHPAAPFDCVQGIQVVRPRGLPTTSLHGTPPARRAVDPGASASPAGLTARARPKARPGTRGEPCVAACQETLDSESPRSASVDGPTCGPGWTSTERQPRRFRRNRRTLSCTFISAGRDQPIMTVLPSWS
jgi:hypothetical protein